MGLTAHSYSRFAAFGAGFFAGFGLFIYFIHGRPSDAFPLTALLFFGLLFGGGYLAQLAFTQLVPAACPRCGAKSAVPPVLEPFDYACGSCGKQSNVFAFINTEMRASMPTPEQEVKRELSLSWIFFAAGIAMIGIGVWLGGDSIQLLREGVSTDARVARVTEQQTRDKDGNSQTTYTAFIEYRVADKGTPLTLERSWSVKANSVSFSGYDNGQQLTVLYLPAEPWRAKVHSFGDLFFAPGLLGGVGLVFAVFGFIMVRQRLRRRPKLEL